MVQQRKLSTGAPPSNWDTRAQSWEEPLRWEEGLRRREEKRQWEEAMRKKDEEIEKLRKENEELSKKKEKEKDKKRREDEERQRLYFMTQRSDELQTAQQMQLIEAEDKSPKHLDALLSGGPPTTGGNQFTTSSVAAKSLQTNHPSEDHPVQSPTGPTHPGHSQAAPTPGKREVIYPPGGGRRSHVKLKNETSGRCCLIM